MTSLRAVVGKPIVSLLDETLGSSDRGFDWLVEQFRSVHSTYVPSGSIRGEGASGTLRG